jgi:hypothetical protein
MTETAFSSERASAYSTRCVGECFLFAGFAGVSAVESVIALVQI